MTKEATLIDVVQTAFKALDDKDLRVALYALNQERDKREGVVTVEVDTVEDPADIGESLIDWAAERERKYGVKCAVAQVFGPGGGNPAVEWRGPREAIERLLADAYSMDADDVAYHIDGE